MDATGLTLTAVNKVQALLSLIALLPLTSFRFPQPDGAVQDQTEYDYIVIGGGTAGSIVASRLTEDPNINVAILESGVEPQIESVLPGLLVIIPTISWDYDFPTEPDNFSRQYLRDQIFRITAGKSLGGSSALQHMILVRGNDRDYQKWADAANDSSWDYNGLLPYFIKSEKLVDEEILNDPTAVYHGTEGYLGLTRNPSRANEDIIKAFEEIGYEYHVNINGNITLGVTEPIYGILDGRRQGTAEGYLRPAKDRRNLHVFTETTVTKIIFDENNNAVGVEAVNSNNEMVTVYARKEVILAAGVMRTPQLLMLSGIGPESELEKFDIPVIAKLPVGKGLIDHVGAVLLYTLDESKEIDTVNLTNFPVPCTLGFKALDPSETYADYQSINLLFSRGFFPLMTVCANVFKYKNEICNEMYNANLVKPVMFSLVNIMQPYSTGNVTLRSTNPFDNPKIHMGYFTNSTDLDNLASYLEDFSAIQNTSYFINAGSEFVDYNLEECQSLEKNSWEYWRCYARVMSTTVWHPVGTAAMGSVLDADLKVREVQRLRVVDAAGIPNVVSGKMYAAVVAFAEKAADLIKKTSVIICRRNRKWKVFFL